MRRYSIYYSLNDNGQPHWEECPPDLQSLSIRHGQPFRPRTWDLIEDQMKSRLKDDWILNDNELQALLDEFDRIAKVAIMDEPRRNPARTVATARLRRLRYALNDLIKPDDSWTNNPMQDYVPSLFNSDGKLKKSVSAAINEINAIKPRTRGNRSALPASATSAAAEMVASWTKVTKRKPDKNKQAPSLTSFYTTVLPILRVQTENRTYYRDGTSEENFSDMSIAAKDEGSPQRWLDALPHAIRQAVKTKNENQIDTI